MKLDAALLNDAGPADASAQDAGSLAPSPDLGFVHRYTAASGEMREGELLYRYDHRNWWMAEATTTALLFDPDRFAPYPNDRSLALLAIDEPLSPQEAPQNWRSYQEHVRARGFVIERSPLDGPAYVITAHERYHLEENGYGDFAWDLVRADAQGRRWDGAGDRNEDYWIFDQPVYLPTAGEVVEVMRDGVDNVPGAYPEGAINNLVGVHLGGQYYLYLLHFRQGSIPPEIAVGAMLSEGAYLGRVGNSGVSLEPHLHLTMLWLDTESGRTWSVPTEFHQLYESERPEGGSLQAWSTPPSGRWISHEPF